MTGIRSWAAAEGYAKETFVDWGCRGLQILSALQLSAFHNPTSFINLCRTWLIFFLVCVLSSNAALSLPAPSRAAQRWRWHLQSVNNPAWKGRSARHRGDLSSSAWLLYPAQEAWPHKGFLSVRMEERGKKNLRNICSRQKLKQRNQCHE